MTDGGRAPEIPRASCDTLPPSLGDVPEISRSQILLYVAAAVLVIAIGARYLHAEAGTSKVATPLPHRPNGGRGQEVAVTRARRGEVVHVAGAVRRPGVYALPAGARVQDAVRRAGGPTKRADLDGLNLAALLQDGVQVVVPERGAAVAAATAGPAAAGGAGVAEGAPVDINTATAEQLDTLDGVGPATAQKILEYRRQHGGFRSPDDLGQIPGIGPKRLAALRGKVRT